MTAQGSRRTVFVIAIAALALLGWWLWPRHVARAWPAAKSPEVTRKGATSASPLAVGRGADSWSSAAGQAANEVAGSDEGNACQAARYAGLRGLRDALDPARSAQDAFAHAVLGELLALRERDEDAQRREWIRLEAEWQAARQRWPRDIDIAWQAAHKCMEKSGCDEGEALDHLLAIDPDNAAGWWLAMGNAWKRGDGLAYDDALAHAAAARGSDTRTGSVFLALQPLLSRVPIGGECVRADDAAELAKALGHAPTDSDWASVEAWSYELAGNPVASISAFSGCRERDAGRLSTRRRENCIAALSVLAGGDTLVEQSISLPLLIQLEGNSAAGLAYRERYRRLLYLFLAAPPTLMPGNPLDLLSAGEVETMRRAAIARHRWPPPDDWLPASVRLRTLITRGRYPPGSD
jgi:hypothetical protein